MNSNRMTDSKDERPRPRIEISGDVSTTPLPWSVTEHAGTEHSQRIACFARHTHAVCFVVAHERIGWSAAESQRSMPTGVPRVLVVVDRGVARTYTTMGVEVVIVDLDAKRGLTPGELAPVHPQFRALLARAGVSWPVAVGGRRSIGPRADQPMWRANEPRTRAAQVQRL